MTDHPTPDRPTPDEPTPEEPTQEPAQDVGEAPPAEEPHDVTGLELARSIARGLAGKTPKQSASRRRPSP